VLNLTQYLYIAIYQLKAIQGVLQDIKDNREPEISLRSFLDLILTLFLELIREYLEAGNF